MKLSFRPVQGDGRLLARFYNAEQMRSAQVRRALIFTASIIMIFAVVGISVYAISSNQLALHRAHKQMSGILSSVPESALSEENRAFCEGFRSGVESYGSTRTGTVSGLGTDVLVYTAGLPELDADAEQFGLSLTMGPRYYVIKDPESSVQCLRGVTVLDRDAEVPILFVADLPVKSFGGGILPVILGLIVAVLCTLAASLPLSNALLCKSVREIRALRDIAVRAAKGELEAHADETVPDEIGELASALNGLSNELARNMYTLIVERNRLKNLLDGLSEGIVAVDNQGEITIINPAIEAMFEQKRIGVGLPDARMKVIPEQSVWEDFDSVVKTGAPVTRNFTIRDTVIRMALTAIVDEIGTTAGAVGLFRDVTQMERLERTRREYVSNVSHELRTPLTAVRGLIEALKDGMVREEADRMRYYDIILRETLRLSRLINDQLELSRLQSGNVAILKQRMNSLDDLIYDVCDRYHSIAEEHGLELNIESDLSGIPSVWSNSDRVEQMLIILVDNAIKYTESGSVNVSATWDEEKVTISVRDTGIGIAEEDLPYVFDRFYKVDKAHSGKGSGLGLSIMTELLGRMHEEVFVESEKGVGSKFSFTIHRGPHPDELEEKQT